MALTTEQLADFRESKRTAHPARHKSEFKLMTRLVADSLRPSYRKVYDALPPLRSITSATIAEKTGQSVHMVATALCAMAAIGMVRRCNPKEKPGQPQRWRRDTFQDYRVKV